MAGTGGNLLTNCEYIDTVEPVLVIKQVLGKILEKCNIQYHVMYTLCATL